MSQISQLINTRRHIFKYIHQQKPPITCSNCAHLTLICGKACEAVCPTAVNAALALSLCSLRTQTSEPKDESIWPLPFDSLHAAGPCRMSPKFILRDIAYLLGSEQASVGLTSTCLRWACEVYSILLSLPSLRYKVSGF